MPGNKHKGMTQSNLVAELKLKDVRECCLAAMELGNEE